MHLPPSQHLNNENLVSLTFWFIQSRWLSSETIRKAYHGPDFISYFWTSILKSRARETTNSHDIEHICFMHASVLHQFHSYFKLWHCADTSTVLKEVVLCSLSPSRIFFSVSSPASPLRQYFCSFIHSQPERETEPS